MNSESSRSHLIFTLYLDLIDKDGDKVTSKVSLVDLAGSERVKATNADSEMIKEASAINQSLSCLQDVMKKLSMKETLIPYRNNKLTFYMSDCLGGNSKSLMFVNVSPSNKNSFDTQQSLVYANRVKLIKNNVFKIHENTQVKHLKTTINDLENEVIYYKQRLNENNI